MENDHPGRLTVDEFLKLSQGVLALFNKTRLSAEDQIKLDLIFNELQANDPRVADALKK